MVQQGKIKQEKNRKTGRQKTVKLRLELNFHMDQQGKKVNQKTG